MNLDPEFSQHRPFYDSEVPEALEQLIQHDSFQQLIPYLSVSGSKEDIMEKLKSIQSIEAFQNEMVYPFVRHIIKETSEGLSSSGVDRIKGKGHLFISNHRDIVLDSAFLQAMLQEKGLPTSEITVGDNLMANSLFNLLGKLNKVFTLKRGGGRIEMYKNAILHSKYIHQLVKDRNESLWIAQRDGRTKDGFDKTQQGLLKMLVGDRRDIIPALQELAIVPMSISYEFEPCLGSKVRELYITETTGEYEKKANEDMESSTSSIFAYKGHIHIAFGHRLNKTLADIESRELSNKEIFDTYVNEVDQQIYQNYKLWPNNYIAYDLVNKTHEFDSNYNKEDKDKFVSHITKALENISGDKKRIKEIALNIYANPVKNSKHL